MEVDSKLRLGHYPDAKRTKDKVFEMNDGFINWREVINTADGRDQIILKYRGKSSI